MSLKQPTIAIAAVALFAVAGSASVSAQENCRLMHHRVMEAYHQQSPHYRQILNHYKASCASGSSQPTEEGNRRRYYEYDRRGEYNHYGNNDERGPRGW